MKSIDAQLTYKLCWYLGSKYNTVDVTLKTNLIEFDCHCYNLLMMDITLPLYPSHSCSSFGLIEIGVPGVVLQLCLTMLESSWAQSVITTTLSQLFFTYAFKNNILCSLVICTIYSIPTCSTCSIDKVYIHQMHLCIVWDCMNALCHVYSKAAFLIKFWQWLYLQIVPMYSCICNSVLVVSCFPFNLCSGEALHWRELCRIQHLPTRQYLAVVKEEDSYNVTLKAKSTGTAFEEDTTFRLVPVIEGDDDVNFGSYARIYHLNTESWLHALRGTVCTSCTLHKCQDEEFDNYVCL